MTEETNTNREQRENRLGRIVAGGLALTALIARDYYLSGKQLGNEIDAVNVLTDIVIGGAAVYLYTTSPRTQ